mmetsp:Transcript_21236/g.44613  ORF Transcript_21236/g.44613 Transcript_21236/m.44613 type:complete len:689 (+) Transcript_21236:84-2150(+)
MSSCPSTSFTYSPPPLDARNDNSDGTMPSLNLWGSQPHEVHATEAAFQKLAWIIRRLEAFTSTRFVDNDGGWKKDLNFMKSDVASNSKTAVNMMVQELFGKFVAGAIFCDQRNYLPPDSFPENVRNHWTHWITISDLRKLSLKIEEDIFGYQSEGGEPCHALFQFITFLGQSGTETNAVEDGTNYSSWDEISRTSVKSWYQLLLSPYRDVARQIILASHNIVQNRNEGNGTNNEINNVSAESGNLPHAYLTTATSVTQIPAMSSTSDQLVADEEIESFLFHQSSVVLTKLQHFIQPSLENRHNEWQDSQILTQIKIQNEWQKRCDAAFEEFDFYCTNVLGVESDILPLYPPIYGRPGYSNDNPNNVDHFKEYSCQVEECVINPMSSELKQLSENFLRLLGNCGQYVEVSNEKESIHKNEPSSFGKCFGKDIHEAVAYYEQFSSFISSPRWNSKPETSPEKEVEDEIDKTKPVMQTLMRYTAINGDVGTKSATRESLVSAFIDSHATRSNLVSDLQNLKSFLYSRKQELASSLTRGGVISTADAINIEWTRWCVTARGKNPLLTQPQYRFEDISTEVVLRLHSAVSNILAHIVGNGFHAKRLRFLADAVGFPRQQSAIDEMKGTAIWSFRHICRRAAELARNMAWCQDQRELSLQSVERARVSAEDTKAEVNVIRNRIEWIRKELDNLN